MKEIPGEYAAIHIEKGEAIEKIPQSLAEPLAKDVEFEGAGETGVIDYYKKPFELEVEGRGLKLNINYSPPNTDETIKQVVAHKIETGKKDEKYDYSQWRILEGLSLKDEAGNELNLDDLLARKDDGKDFYRKTRHKRDTTVLFNTTQEVPTSMGEKNEKGKWGSQGSARFDKNAVIIKQNIASPSTIAMLLHEIGHLQKPPSEEHLKHMEYARTANKKWLSEEEKNDPNLAEKIADDILAMERDAWAWAINKLRPFVASGAISQEDLLDFVHKQALKSYSEYINQILLNPTLKVKVQKKVVGLINNLTTSLMDKIDDYDRKKINKKFNKEMNKYK